MIYETLSFLATEINHFLNIKIGNVTDARLKIGNVSRALDDSLTGPNSLNGKAVLSLVNIEEDKVSKQQEQHIKKDTTTLYKQPPLYLNLYVLVAINKAEYDDSLKWISWIIQFFQYQNVFTPVSHPDLLDKKIEKLIVDLHTLNFEQLNHLWSMLGGKYLPSVMYKVRQITIDEDVAISEGGFIKEIKLNEKVKRPVT